MGGIFGKTKSHKKPVVTDVDRAILQLKQQRDKIKQFAKRVNLQLESERQVARELLQNGKKDKALLILKKKKRMENTLEKADGQLENLEKMVADMEFAQIEMDVVEGLKIGNESLKQLHALMSIDNIEALLDETREGVEKQREIDELLGGSFSVEDEADLLAELEELTASEAEKEPELELPEVPTTELVTEKPVPEKRREARKKEAVAAS